MQKFTRNTYEFVKQGLLQIQDEITKGERVCATRALKGIIGTMAPNREALLGYAYVRVRNRVGSKYGNTNRRAEIIAEKSPDSHGSFLVTSDSLYTGYRSVWCQIHQYIQRGRYVVGGRGPFCGDGRDRDDP